jgi:predicted metal-dependent hydrolase
MIPALNDNEGTMSLDWNDGALAEGLRCYRNGEFFLAHEHWEAIWLKCEEPEKTFLQALIQVTAAFHHLQRGNRIGAGSLLRAALRRLDRFPDEYGDIAVEALRKSIGEWLRILDVKGAAPELQFPLIRGGFRPPG